MGKIIEQKITAFNGGISNDLRVNSSNKFALTKHFDTFTYPHKLVPYFKTTNESENKTYDIKDFVYAPIDTAVISSGFVLWGYGLLTTTTLLKYLDVDAGSTTWVEPVDAGAAGARMLGTFFYYKDYLYFFSGTTALNRYNVLTATMTNAYQTLTTITSIARPVHHAVTDTAYFFVNNLVYQQTDNGTSWSLALTLPSNLKIVQACAHGNYLAIGCTTKGSGDASSVVYLWDMDSTLNDLTEIIDFGKGNLEHLASLDNRLTAVIKEMGSNKGKNILVKQSVGNLGITVSYITRDDSVNAVPTYILENTYEISYKKDNRLYFPYAFPYTGDSRFGIWSVDSSGKLSLDFIEEEANKYNSIYQTAGRWWIAHSSDGSINRESPDTFSTTLSSIYESVIFNEGDSDLTKKLIGVTVMTEPLPTAGQIILKYCKDEDLDNIDGSVDRWTTIFTHTTDNSISHGTLNIESTGVNLPQYKEIQFRIESIGGAVITGLKYKAEIIDKQLY